MNKPGNYYAKWRKHVMENYIPCGSTYTKCQEQANPHRRKVDWWLPKSWVEEAW
jgi:hypothetical protein